MKLEVREQSLTKDKDLVLTEPYLTAVLSNGKILVEGRLPSPINSYITPDQINLLEGDEAIKMFSVLAASRYGNYDSISLEGISPKEILGYLNKSFTPADVKVIRMGIDNSRVLGSL